MMSIATRSFQLKIFKGSLYGALGTVLSSLPLLYYINLVAQNDNTNELTIFYLCYSVLMLISLIDFGLGYRFLVANWRIKNFIIRVVLSVICLITISILLKSYVQFRFNANISVSYTFVSALGLWMGNFSKYIMDRVKLFFFGSLFQVLPSLLIFRSQAGIENCSIYSEGGILSCTETYFVIFQMLLTAALILKFSLKFTDRKGNFRAEIYYSVTLIFALLTVRFDRLWLTNYAEQGDLAIYYTITEVCMRMGFLGAMISRVAIPYLSDEPSKIGMLHSKLEQRLLILALILFLTIGFIITYLYLPGPIGHEFYYTFVACGLALTFLSLGQVYYTLLVATQNTLYIVLSQVVTLTIYALISFSINLDYPMLLVTWLIRIVVEVTFLRVWCKRELNN